MTENDAQRAFMLKLDGVDVRLTAAAGNPEVKRAFWDGNSLEAGERGGPAITIPLADLPDNFEQGAKVRYPIIDGTNYTVTHKAPDGHGWVLLTLQNESSL